MRFPHAVSAGQSRSSNRSQREKTLFSLDGRLYPKYLTSTYFTGQVMRNLQARRGYLRDKRGNAPAAAVSFFWATTLLSLSEIPARSPFAVSENHCDKSAGRVCRQTHEFEPAPRHVLKPDRGTTFQRKLGLIESDDEKSRFSAARFRAENADFGEDSRILALDAAEKPIGQTRWRRAQS